MELSANKFRITYNSTRHARLNESHSADLLDRPLRLLNPVFVSIVEGTRLNTKEMDEQTRSVTVGIINKLTASYNETLINHVSARTALLGKLMPIAEKLRKVAQNFGMEDRLPDISLQKQFGYASYTNGTYLGPFEIYTGYRETARSLGDLISYKGKRRLDYYEGRCNRLQASAGELRPMPVEPDKLLELFQPGFCRIVHLKPTGQTWLREGQAINYIIAPEDLLSASKNPDNRCYCTNSTPFDDHCSLDGVVELAPCSFGAPIMMSVSHVPLDGRITSTIGNYDDELLRADVEELHQSDDQAQMVILKRVGVPIKADLTVTLLMKVIRDAAFK